MAERGAGTADSRGLAEPPLDAVLFASYGTSREDARAASIAPVAACLREGLRCAADLDDPVCTRPQRDHDPFGDGYKRDHLPVFAEAYTSAKARRALARRGVPVPDVSEALHELARAGARTVLVQPGHLVYGTAFAQVERAVEECRFLFANLVLGKPLLASDADLAELAVALDARHPRREGEALVLVAHGVEEGGAPAGSVYASLGLRLRELGRDDAYVGSMHGYPGLKATRRLVALDRERLGTRAVRLVPLMLTAAAHAARDIAGEREGSWRRAFEADGCDVTCELEGLGALPAVRQMYLRHAREALVGLRTGVDVAPEAAAAAPARFPLFVSLQGERCLVVGLGHVGLRRARMLASFGAEVHALDPSPSEAAQREAAELGISLERRTWLPADVGGARLVVAATNARSVNAVVARACGRLGVPVSVADSAEESTFFFPAVCESPRLVAGLVSRGAAHELVARVAPLVREVLREADHD